MKYRWVNVYHLKTAPDQIYMHPYKKLTQAKSRIKLTNEDFVFEKTIKVKW